MNLKKQAQDIFLFYIFLNFFVFIFKLGYNSVFRLLKSLVKLVLKLFLKKKRRWIGRIYLQAMGKEKDKRLIQKRRQSPGAIE